MMRTSRKPCVVMRPVFAPLRSSTALVATVVACSTTSTEPPRTPVAASSLSSPSITASPGLAELVATFKACVAPVASSDSTKSVKVPPISNATRIMRSSKVDCRQRLRRQLAVGGIEGMAKPSQHLVDLAFRDDEGRSKGKAVADDAQHQAVLVADAFDDLAGAASGHISCPPALVLDQLDAGDQ